MMVETFARPCLRFAVREDGTLEVCSPWFPLIEVRSTDLMPRVGRGVTIRDGELTFRCANGGARYRLSRFEGGLASGRLLESW